MKQCSICKVEFNLDNFYKDKHTKSGLDHRCKPCARKRTRESRNPEVNRRSSAIHRKKFPKKVQARNKIHYHVKVGNIIRPDHCEECGTKCKTHAHHCDYSKPLDVIWFCKSCHQNWHNNNEVINAE